MKKSASKNNLYDHENGLGIPWKTFLGPKNFEL